MSDSLSPSCITGVENQFERKEGAECVQGENKGFAKMQTLLQL